MKKLFAILISIVVFLALLPAVVTSTDEYNYQETTQSHTAVQDNATDEVITLDNTPVSVEGVTVNGTALTVTTEYTVSGDNVTVLTSNSTTDDTIVVSYTYEIETTVGVDSLVTLLPLLFTVIVVVGVAVAVKFKN